VAGEHFVAEHFFDFFLVARHFGADARLVANAVQAAAARGLEKNAAARSERSAIELFVFFRVGAGEIGGSCDPVVDHALALVAENVDACAAALLFAREGRAIRLTQ